MREAPKTNVKTKWIPTQHKYTGSELTPQRNYLRFGLLGDSCIAFIGPCEVSFDHMLDGEDLRARSEIRGSLMLHFICEIFDRDLAFAVALQRLWMRILKDELNAETPALRKKPLCQDGDDIYWGDRKLSISIASSSPVSELIHLAVNVSNKGTPVKTCALEDFGTDPKTFAKRILNLWSHEYLNVVEATRKVLPTQ